LFLAQLFVGCIFVGCTQRDAAVEQAAKRATAEPAATSTASPTVSPSGSATRRASFGTNTAWAPRDPNSVFMNPAVDFLAKLQARSYVLTPTQLPEPNPTATGYAVQGTSVTIAIAEEESKLRVAGLIMQAADLKQADSPAAKLMKFVTETIAGISPAEAESQRLRVIREHEARVRQSGEALGSRSNPVMMHYYPGPNDAMRLSFSKGSLLSERSPPALVNPNQKPNVNLSNPGLTPPKAMPRTSLSLPPAPSTPSQPATQADPKQPLGLPVSKAAMIAALQSDGFKVSLQPTDDSSPAREFTHLDDANGLLISAEVEGLFRWVIVQPRSKGTTDQDQRLAQAAKKIATLLLELPANKIAEEFAAATVKFSDTSATRPSSRYHDVAGTRAHLRIANGPNGVTYTFRPEPLQPVKP
jgi:hypothetical protein